MLQTKIQIVTTSIGVILGLAAFICFCILSNIEAAIWALFAVLHAGLGLMLHCHYMKESLHVNFSRKALQYLGDLGIIGFVCGGALTLFYIFLECYYKVGVTPVGTSIVIRLVWSFFMTKYAFLLYYSTKTYLRTYNDHQLFSENPNIEEA